MNGKLFSQDFLLDGICGTPVWEGLPNVALDTFLDGLKRIYAPLTANSPLNEANTEADIIEQVLGTAWLGRLDPQASHRFQLAPRRRAGLSAVS